MAVIGSIVYVLNSTDSSEKFTEFYILGITGKATDYPSEFTMQDSKVVSVLYGDGDLLDEQYGRVTLEIVDHEQQQQTTYTVEIKINGSVANIYYQGQTLNQLGGITLKQGQTWENQIGFAPTDIGENQEVDLLLYKGGGTVVYNELNLWVGAN